jgi:hypothetical protein
LGEVSNIAVFGVGKDESKACNICAVFVCIAGQKECFHKKKIKRINGNFKHSGIRILYMRKPQGLNIYIIQYGHAIRCNRFQIPRIVTTPSLDL